MSRVKDIIAELRKITTFNVSSTASTKEKKAKERFKSLIWISSILIFIVIMLSLAYKFDIYVFRTSATKYVVYCLYVIGILLIVWAFMEQNILTFIGLYRWKENSNYELASEVAHDESNAKSLIGDVDKPNYSVQELEYARFCIERVIERLKNRVTGILGGHTALLSGMLSSLSLLDKIFTLAQNDDIKNGTLFEYISHSNIPLYFLAFILGISLGVLMLKKIAEHHSYYIDTINLAIRIIETNRNSPHA